MKNVLIVVLLLLCCSTAQSELITRDSLTWMQQEYGWLEYFIPTNEINHSNWCCPDLPPDYDTLCTCYLDSIYVLVHVDSTEIPEIMNNWFEMTQVTKSVWVGSFMFVDTGTRVQVWTHPCSTGVFVDTLFSTGVHRQGMMVHVMVGVNGVVPPIWEQ